MTYKDDRDIIIVGGGAVGAALAYGLAGSGASVALLDEGDAAFRAAFGNFGLVWFQGKGLGNQHYVDFVLEATRKWPSFAERLERQTGICINYRKQGGMRFCLGEADFEKRRQLFDDLAGQSKSGLYDGEMIDRAELEKLIPQMKLGPKISGASFCRHDGHVNPLFLIRALHAAFINAGGKYYPGHTVREIHPEARTFSVATPKGRFRAAKLVLAAGVGLPALAARLELDVPVRPQRGQLIVTERLLPLLPYPADNIRQTEEGSFLLGLSNEEVGFDTAVTMDILKKITKKAVETFPGLGGVQMLRFWASLRPLTPDQYPVYHQSERFPGAYIVTSHSAVTLASLHADTIARWIRDGTQPEGFEHFSLRRFDV